MSLNERLQELWTRDARELLGGSKILRTALTVLNQ